MGFDRNLRDDVTHWPVSGTDGFGGFAFSAPVLLRGRWQERAELFRDEENEERVSKAVIYLSTAVANGDYLALGDYVTPPNLTADPNTLDTDASDRVAMYSRSTDLASLYVLHKAIL